MQAEGLFSRLVKFIRNPAANWTELENKVIDSHEVVSKLLLKEMIERKRRNDFVRKRELDMLRKMRESRVKAAQESDEMPSFFINSMPSKLLDRAKTIKKIDEIEAQMSLHWWKTKQGTQAALQSLEPANFQLGGAVVPVRGMPKSESQRPAKTPQLAAINARAAVVKSPAAGSFDLAYSNNTALDLQLLARDAELEQAAISFAGGDAASAEASLLDMLAPDGSRTAQSEVWRVLFDLYRATDSQDKFETAAIKFGQKFDCSTPQWFSLLEMLQQLAAAAAEAPVTGQTADWTCSPVLTVQTLAGLRAALAKAPMPWRLNWSKLKTIQPNAVELLYKVFADWSQQSLQLRFMGHAQLHRILQNATPSGDRSTPQVWWQLRLEALRVMHRHDAFELAALDFCVTYEVSPPAWELARCAYQSIDSQGRAVAANGIIGEVSREPIRFKLSAFDGDTNLDAPSSPLSQRLSVELSGQMEGGDQDDAEGALVALLKQLQTKLIGADIVMISCTKLIRVDYSAAAMLLNWVLARRAENQTVQFSDVNRLVAVLFNVVGITQHAKVTTRRH